MKITKTDMFATPVWEVQTDFDANFNLNLIEEVNKYYSGITSKKIHSNIWCSDTPNINKLGATILDIVKDLTYKYVESDFSGEFNYLHTRGWVHYHQPNQCLPTHGHGGSKITATYYINAPVDSGNLILIDPRGGVDWDKSNDGQLGSKTCAITPTTGKLVFFPSFMLHSVDSNMSNAVRISLSTDISILSQKSIEDFLESLQR